MMWRFPLALCVALSMLFTAGVYAQQENLLARIDFDEGQGYAAGGELEVGGLWTLSGGMSAYIEPGENPSLRLDAWDPEAKLGLILPQPLPGGMRWVEVWVRPAVGDGVFASLNLWGTWVGFGRGEKEKVVVVVADYVANRSLSIKTEAELSETGESRQWLQLGVMQDLDAGSFDFYVNGERAAKGLGWSAEDGAEFAAYGLAGRRVYLDAMSVTAVDRPLEEGEEIGEKRNGEPSVVEGNNEEGPALRRGGTDIEAESSKVAGDKAKKEDLTGLARGEALETAVKSHVKEYGAYPVIYVDNISGNDADTGERSVKSGGKGPKRTIQAAIKRVPWIALVLLPSDIPYQIPRNGDKDTVLEIVPVGPGIFLESSPE